MSHLQMLQTAHPLIHISVLLAENRLNQLVRASFAEKPSKHYVLGDFCSPGGQVKPTTPGFNRILVTDHQTLGSEREFQNPENRGRFSDCSLILLQGKQDKPLSPELAFQRVNRVIRSEKVNEVIDDLHKTLRKETAYLIRQLINLQAEVALTRLSPRETEVLGLMVQGYAIPEIGEALSIAGPTVKIHKAKVLEKTGCKNLRQLILTFAPRYLNDEALFK